MTDPLEQLKQQLYAKLLANTKPEQQPSDLDLLKPSQLPTYQAHQELRRQTEQQWKRSPSQGATPSHSFFAPADEVYLLEVLTECRAKLDSALTTAQRYPRLRELETAISDAITGIHQAAAVVIDPELYLD